MIRKEVPLMPDTEARKDPYSAFNFLLEIDGVVVASFSECSGLTGENDPTNPFSAVRNAAKPRVPRWKRTES